MGYFNNTSKSYLLILMGALSSAQCAPILINPLCTNVNTNTFQQGKGTRTDPYLVCSVAQWQNMGTYLDKSFKLGKDLDFTGVTYTPIGVGSTFTGTFDGGGYTVSNITYTSATNAGLFGDVTGSVSNLRILNPTISAADYVGAITPYLSGGGTVSSITVVGASITGTGNIVGGVVGAAYGKFTISNCSSAGTITGNQYTGGLAGATVKIGTDCGTVSGSSSAGTVNGADDTGGLIGAVDDYCTITSSSTSANVSGNQNVGGVIGRTFGPTITGVTSTGTVTGSVYTGGVIGYVNGATISKCGHSTGAVTGTTIMVGALVAGFEAGTMSHCYFHSAALTSPAGSNVGGIVAAAIAGSITYSYSSPTTLSAGGGGGDAAIPVGVDFSGGALIDNTTVFYNTTTAGAGSDGVAHTTAEMMDPSTYSAAGFSSSIWNLDFTAGSGFPTLR